MPNWKELTEEISKLEAQTREAGSPHDKIRKKYMEELHKLTKRNVIIYYSSWLNKPGADIHPVAFSINEADKNGFMSALNGMDKKLGLDLFLHTPGGSVSDTESLVSYLRSFFDGDIRAIIPQVAQSAGTMIALSCKEIVMGRQSRLGPIDPQLGGTPAHFVIQDFEQTFEKMKTDPHGEGLAWLQMVSRYPPHYYNACKKAMEWSREMVEEWLATGMFLNDPNGATLAREIANDLSDTDTNKAHDRAISFDRLEKLGVKVVKLEDNQELQDAVLTVHHATMATLINYPIIKLIDSHRGDTTLLGFKTTS